MKSATLKMIGIDVHEEVTDALVNAGIKFANEIGCPVEEVCIRIRYARDGYPYYELYHVDTKMKKNNRVRDAKLEEII